MDIHSLLLDRTTLTVATLTELGESRHIARHALEDLVVRGLALKTKEGNTVTYTRTAPVPEPDEKVQVVVNALRHAKAISVARISRRTNLPVVDVRQALVVAVALGLAVKPYKSLRFRRA